MCSKQKLKEIIDRLLMEVFFPINCFALTQAQNHSNRQHRLSNEEEIVNSRYDNFQFHYFERKMSRS